MAYTDSPQWAAYVKASQTGDQNAIDQAYQALLPVIHQAQQGSPSGVPAPSPTPAAQVPVQSPAPSPSVGQVTLQDPKTGQKRVVPANQNTLVDNLTRQGWSPLNAQGQPMQMKDYKGGQMFQDPASGKWYNQTELLGGKSTPDQQAGMNDFLKSTGASDPRYETDVYGNRNLRSDQPGSNGMPVDPAMTAMTGGNPIKLGNAIPNGSNGSSQPWNTNTPGGPQKYFTPPMGGNNLPYLPNTVVYKLDPNNPNDKATIDAYNQRGPAGSSYNPQTGQWTDQSGNVVQGGQGPTQNPAPMAPAPPMPSGPTKLGAALAPQGIPGRSGQYGGINPQGGGYPNESQPLDPFAAPNRSGGPTGPAQQAPGFHSMEAPNQGYHMNPGQTGDPNNPWVGQGAGKITMQGPNGETTSLDAGNHDEIDQALRSGFWKPLNAKGKPMAITDYKGGQMFIDPDNPNQPQTLNSLLGGGMLPEQQAGMQDFMNSQGYKDAIAGFGDRNGQGGSSGGPTGPASQLGPLLAPFNQPFTGASVNPVQQFGTTYVPQFYDNQFKAPTADEVLNDPGYQFTRDQGQKAIERSAAAGGNLMSGGTAKGLVDYGQGLASTKYQDVYNRKLGESMNNYNIFQGNQGLRKNAFDTNYNTWQGNNNQQQQGYNNAMNEYRMQHDIFKGNQNDIWNKLSSASGEGQTTANQLGWQGSQAGGQFGNTTLGAATNIGNFGIGSANAIAGGITGNAQAVNNGIGNMNNAAQMYMYMKQMGMI